MQQVCCRRRWEEDAAQKRGVVCRVAEKVTSLESCPPDVSTVGGDGWLCCKDGEVLTIHVKMFGRVIGKL